MEPELLNQIPESLRAQVASAFSGKDEQVSQANQQVDQVKEQVNKAHARIAQLEDYIERLKEQVRLYFLKKYGPKSEQLTDAQLSLLELEPIVSLAEVEAEAALPEADKAVEAAPEQAEESKGERKKPVRAPLPKHLPREERIIKLPEEKCTCEQCQREKDVIGYERSERLNVKPAIYYVEETLREKRACRRCEEMGVSVAPVPASIVEKGILADRLVVDVIIKKFCEHNPLYRQAASIRRDAQVPVSESTLGSATMKVGELLIPICVPMKADLKAGGYIQADETTTPVQSERHKGRNHQGYMWEYGRPFGPVVYDFRMGREREGPMKFLAGYNGKLQTDAYAAYETVGGPGLTHFGCMAHARRKFDEAIKLNPKDAQSAAILKEIGNLYAVESDAREAHLTPIEREGVRRERSVPVLEKIKEMLIQARAGTLPKLALGKACAYALGQWQKLKRYAEEGNGEVEIDNNWAENGMRGIALGRRNWLHIGSETAGPKIAAILSILETCKRLKINPREYLEDVLPKIADWNSQRVAELTPMAWLKARAQQAD